MILDRDVRGAGAAAVLLAVVAATGEPLAFFGAVLAVVVTLWWRLPHGGLLASLAVALVWSNVVVVLGDEASAPDVVRLLPQVLLAAVLLWRLLRGRLSVAATPPFRALLLYGVALLLSGLTAGEADLAVEAWGEFLLEGLLLWFLVVNVVADRRAVGRVLLALVAAGGLLGAVAVYQHATTPGDGGDADLVVIEGAPTTTDAERPAITLPFGERSDPDELAQLLAVTLPLALALGGRVRGWGAGVQLVATAAIVAGIGVAGSGGAAVGALVGVVLLAAWRRLTLRSVVAVALAAAVLVAVPGDIDLRWGAGTETEEVGDTAPVDAAPDRRTENLVALDMYLDHPVTGVGPLGYAAHHEEYAEALGANVVEPAERADNLYAQVAAELGTLGLAALAAVFALVVRELWWARRRQDAASAHADVLAALLVAVGVQLVTGGFFALASERYLWLLLAVADAAARVLKPATGGAGGGCREPAAGVLPAMPAVPEMTRRQT